MSSNDASNRLEHGIVRNAVSEGETAEVPLNERRFAPLEYDGCYLGDTRLFGYKVHARDGVSFLGVSNVEDGRLVWSNSSVVADCTSFGANSFSYCQMGDHSNSENSEEVGFVSFESGLWAQSVQTFNKATVRAEDWRDLTLLGSSLASPDGSAIVVWGRDSDETASTPIILYSENAEHRKPVLMDYRPGAITSRIRRIWARATAAHGRAAIFNS